MSGEVSFLKLSTNNPATNPALTDALKASVQAKAGAVLTVLRSAAQAFSPVTFANSFGAEDMVLTDIIFEKPTQYRHFFTGYWPPAS